MPYNRQTHHRQSIRLKGYDYAQAGLYFITICCHDRICRFGHIENDEMILNECGKVAHDEWAKLPDRFPNFVLDVFQIMPNHIHAVISLDAVGATLAVAQNTPNDPVAQNTPNDPVAQNTPNDPVAPNDPVPPNDPVAPNDPVTPNDPVDNTGASTISDIVGAYKSLVANGCLGIYKTKNETMGKLWQRNYYEHIIRNENEYQRISEYIINNPKQRVNDKLK